MNNFRRNLIFVPEINPSTFVLFYYEGDTDSRSYSIREFKEFARTALTSYADKFPYTAGQILELSQREGCYCVPVQPHRVDDVSFWYSEILKANNRYLSRQGGSERSEVMEGFGEREDTSSGPGLISGNSHIQLAIEQMNTEIVHFETEIAKRKQAIESLSRLGIT